MAAEFPDLSQSLDRIMSRLVDLLPIVRRVYFPEFHFSNSIKAVAPALCDEFSYDDLGHIADGTEASEAFLRLASGQMSRADEVNRLQVALRAYCRHDSLTWLRCTGR